MQLQLLLAALAIVRAVLRPGGAFVAKVFATRDVAQLLGQMRAFFAEVALYKPRSSRATSTEAFVVCRGHAPPPGVEPPMLRALLAGGGGGDALRPPAVADAEDAADAADAAAAAAAAAPAARVVPFLACGDLSGYAGRLVASLPTTPSSLPSS